MFDRDIWQEIFYSIKSNKLRTFLTGFSVAWGIFILVMLLGSVNGMQNGFASNFNDDATNTIFVRTGTTAKAYAGFEAGRRVQLRNGDIEYIKRSFPDSYEYISGRYYTGVSARYKSETGSYNVQGIHPDHQIIEKTIITEGRFVNLNDIVSAAKVAVIGRKVGEDLFKRESALGKFVEFNGIPFRVIGVFIDEGDDNAERGIYAPITTFQRMHGNTDKIHQIALTYNPDFKLQEALAFSERIEQLLKRRHKIAPKDQSGMRVFNYAEIFSDIGNFTSILNKAGIFIGLLILISGIVGIGNIMVFIIKERTKEIGIRKALGAEPAQIVKLVLIESVFITASSGFIGLLFATTLLAIVGPLFTAPAFTNPSVDLSIVITATIILVVSGVVAGLIPALKAAKVKPIVALRDK
ncbi:MAG: ABC transporter permease [Cellulophaga sp.]